MKPPTTLCALFDGLKPESSHVALGDEAAVAPAVKAHVSGLRWVAGAAELLPTVAELLDVPLSHVFVAFWQKAEEIARALDESRRSSDQSSSVSLDDCSTTATLEPYIEVRIGGAPRGRRIPITVLLPITFRSVKLNIQSGSIVSVAAGECTIDGEVKLVDVTLAKLKEPVTMTLGEWQLAAEDSV